MGAGFMKIGQYAKKYQVSVDTIRYYMELMLIIPEKVGGQYEFDSRCQNDLEEILWLKSADFSLQEIQKVFTLKRLTNLKDDEDMAYYKSLFNIKKQKLLTRRIEIDNIIEKIDDKIITTDTADKNSHNKGITLGIPLGFLPLLACPTCKGSLGLLRGNIEDNLILHAELKCSCGFELKIREGIIIIEKDCKKIVYHPDELEGHYIEQTSSDYVNLLYKSSQWIWNKLDVENLHDSIILEPGTGSGIFLNAILKDLPQETFYICIDHNLELLENAKKNIQKHHDQGNIIFICCDFLNIPVKDGSIDILLDHFGTTNYNFYKEGFLINLIDRLVKPGGKWIGDYLSFKPNAKSLIQYAEKNRKYFYTKNIMNALENSSFMTLEMKDMGNTEKGGIYETFFIEGDTLYDLVYYGEKPK